MDNKLLLDAGGHLQIRDKGREGTIVPFPVCLAVKNDNDVPELCPDFVLDLNELWVFIRTEVPFAPGTLLLLHFYIPPQTKLLAEVWGRVVSMAGTEDRRPGGMLVRLAWFSRWKLRRLERYAKGEEPLVDKVA